MASDRKELACDEGLKNIDFDESHSYLMHL
jgi:hypothetical protein